LSMEKEMLGIYVTGHPLEKIKDDIEKIATINTLKMTEITENGELSQDGQNVKYIGIITSVKKKFTKKNTIMSFLTVEDLYGTTEIIVFDSCYNRCSALLVEETIVTIEGRLSIREDEPVKIVASNITEYKKVKVKPTTIKLDITNIEESKKEKLRGAIKFFAGDKNNMKIYVIDNNELKPCGAIYATEQVIKEFVEILGKDRVVVE